MTVATQPTNRYLDRPSPSSLADVIVMLAREFAPDRCRSAQECFQLTRDVRESVRLMMEYLQRPDLLDRSWVSPWAETA